MFCEDSWYWNVVELPDNIEYCTVDLNYLYHSYNDVPARILLTSDGRRICMEWYKHGKLHRRSRPAVVRYYEDSTVYEKIWYFQGLVNSFNHKRAYAKYYQGTKNPMIEKWYRFNKLYRPKDKAVVVYYYPDKYRHISAKLWFLQPIKVNNPHHIHNEHDTKEYDKSIKREPYYVKYNRKGNIIHSSFNNNYDKYDNNYDKYDINKFELV